MQVVGNGAQLLSLGSDGHVAIWDVASGALKQRFALVGVSGHTVARVTQCGTRLLTGVSLVVGDPAIVWDLAREKALHAMAHPGGHGRAGGTLRMLEVSPCGQRAVTIGWDRIVALWCVETGELQRTLDAPGHWTTFVTVSRGAGRVIGGGSGEIFVWDGDAGEVHDLTVPGGKSAAFATLRDGGRIVAISSEGAAIYDAWSGRRLIELEGDSRDWERLETHLAVSADGRVVAALGRRLYSDWAIRRGTSRMAIWAAVWDTSTGRRLHSESGFTDVVEMPCFTVAVSPPQSVATAMLG